VYAGFATVPRLRPYCRPHHDRFSPTAAAVYAPLLPESDRRPRGPGQGSGRARRPCSRERVGFL